ncbi:phospholipase B1, membrane-associated-like isoform 2-T2 [Spinachia spinachia]
MTRWALILLAALVGPCAQFTDAVNVDVGKNKLSTEKIENDMSILCSPIPAPLSSTSSVHTLRPDDISAVYVLGTPVVHRYEASRVVSRVAELVSMFNSEVLTQHVDPTSVQPRSLLKEAEQLSVSLSNQETDWKLVLLFVPADSTCACSSRVAAEVEAVVQEVEAALQLLQKKLHHTLVHVVVWSSNHQQEKCQCLRAESINWRLRKATLLKMLQESLSYVLENPKWHSGRADFTAVLQSQPVILEPISDSEDTASDLNQLAVQLWTNILQPSTGEAEVRDPGVITFPCPTQERPFLRTEKNSPAERVYSEASTLAEPVMGTVIPCTDRSPSPAIPNSVHELRPGDVKVVAAVGDSLTAANGVGAKTDNLLLVINEYRGLSWSIGGDENITTVTTLPNLLREFNPSLAGFSEGVGSEDSPKAFLNQAVAGAKSGDMVQQVLVLVDKMKSDSRIDFHNDWKVITMFISGNDLCDFCTDSVLFSPRNVVGHIRRALDILHSQVPRAIVNLIELLDIVPLRDLHNDKTLGCPTWFVNLVCPCVLKPKEGSSELQKVKDFNKAYQRAMGELIDSARYDTHANFTVVLQPFLREVFLPRLENGRPDRSYFSPDCFHLSQKAHTLMAQALWNNMLEPVGNKTATHDFLSGINLKCPSRTNPFFRTAINSNYTFPGPPPSPPPATNWGSDFSCNTAPSNSVPTSAHRLRPADINVVAAVGDSLTTGYGAKAKNLLQLRTEYKGVSWSIGGDKTLETVTTLPNILKKFNPEIKGASKGQGQKQTGFNMAVSGAKVAGIPGQVRRLIDAMKNDSTVDFENDWKLVTLFIGGNDLCQYCNDRVSLSPQNYSRHLMTGLDMLYKEVPKMIVNILEILEIEGLRRLKKDSLGCNVLQKFVCPCFLLPGEDSPELAEIKRINRELQIETEKLVYGDRYAGREDFAAVVQPFFRNSMLPLNSDGRPDTTYFSVDCFHFSERGHADMASALWNNMLEPVGKKQTYNSFTNTRKNIRCPTEEHPYFFTKVNSVASCNDNVPVWLAAVLAVTGLLIGWAVTWLFLSCSAKRSKQKIFLAEEMKGTVF